MVWKGVGEKESGEAVREWEEGWDKTGWEEGMTGMKKV
jgi:hypothetical protein